MPEVAPGRQGRLSETSSRCLTDRAQSSPDRRIFTFLEDGEGEGRHWTYSQLDESARRIAAWLQERTSPGDRAILACSAGSRLHRRLFRMSLCRRHCRSCLSAATKPPVGPARGDRSLRDAQSHRHQFAQCVRISTASLHRSCGQAPLAAGRRDRRRPRRVEADRRRTQIRLRSCNTLPARPAIPKA